MQSIELISVSKNVPNTLADSYYTLSSLKKEAMLTAVQKLLDRGDLSLNIIRKPTNNGNIDIIAEITENKNV